MRLMGLVAVAAMSAAACDGATTVATPDSPGDHAMTCLAYVSLHRGDVLQGGGDAHELDAIADAWRAEALTHMNETELEQYYASSVAVLDDEGAAKYESEALRCSAEARALPGGATIDDRIGAVRAVKAALDADLGQPVWFPAETVSFDGDWAWLVGVPSQLRGQDIDWARTRYAERAAEGVLDGGGTTYALVQRQNGVWVVRDFVVGPTDVAYMDWPQRYGAPAALMGLNETP